MNRYIKAMEIGNRYENEGISYYQLKEILEKELNLKLEKLSEVTFLFWFIESFSNGHFDIDESNKKGWKTIMQKYLEEGNSGMGKMTIQNIITDLKGKWFLKGETAKQYYDYLILKQARSSSKWALWFNVISIMIAVAALFYTMYKPEPLYPAPPYEVKLNDPVKLDDESIDKIKVLTKDSIR